MDAPTRHGVERRGEWRDEGLALAGLHLGDLALVQDHAADQLDVEMAHAELAPADLARRGEHLRQRVVEDALEMLHVGLLARPADLAPALGRGCVELLVGWLARRAVL